MFSVATFVVLTLSADPASFTAARETSVTDLQSRARPLAEEEVISGYLAAAEQLRNEMRGVSMDVDIEAKLPKLKKEGRFRALKFISKLGQISFISQAFTGDNTVKKEVIARYLTEEAKVRDPEDVASIAISPQNYKFKYKGLVDRENRQVHVVQLSPRKKRVGLFKGELWLDPETFLPLRETGRFVKSPSVFLKKIEFTRNYQIQDGVAIPNHIQSTIETRIIGKAELSINFSNFARQEAEPVAVTSQAFLGSHAR